MMWDKFKSSLPSMPPSALPEMANADVGEALPLASLGVRRARESAWSRACAAYLQLTLQHALPKRAVPFVYFGVLHLVVAEMLWERRDEIRKEAAQRVLHFAGTAGLVAVYSPAQRKVQLREPGTALGKITGTQDLSMRIMPATARLLEGDAAQGFVDWPLAMLLWHFGQTSAQALDHMPMLQQQNLHLRRFPPLAPGSLHMRHLALMYQLSRAHLSFEQLQAVLPQEDHAYLCPDLTSLYLTGALQLKSSD
jgi:hypothetical protein